MVLKRIKRHWLLVVAAAALTVAAVVAYAPGVDAAGVSTTPQQRIQAPIPVPFYWAGWRNWDGKWCTGLFSDSGKLQWFYCQ